MKDWKKLCVNLAGLGAFLICIPVMYRIHEGDKFNAMSYFLWSALSLVCTIVLIRDKRGGYVLMGCYILSDLSIGLYSYHKVGKGSFGPLEWLTVVLTIICAIIYWQCELRKNLRPAVIANGSALMMSGIPVAVESIMYPYQMSLIIAGLYIAISALSYYGEKDFNGRLVPVLSIIYWVVIIIGMVIARSLT